MYHSITFGEKNSWDDWFLIPTSRPVFNPPEPKTKYIDIPGADGHLDLTTSLTGDVAYDMRKGSIEFLVDNDHAEWHVLYSDIMDYLHGRELKAVLEDDPSYYYEGRFSVNKWKSDKHNSKITIDYVVHPYKLEQTTSLDEWLWDPFDFNNGVIRNYRDLRVDGVLALHIPGIRMRVTPSYEVHSDRGDGMLMTYEGVTYRLPNGASRIIEIRTGNGDNLFTFVGHGTVSVEYRGGRL